jgi:SAM-dependent methyltransferase
MDSETLQVYNKKSTHLFSKYSDSSEGISKYFQKAFLPKSNILDIGSGSGRDLYILNQSGYNAVGVEPSIEMVKLALLKYPELKDKLHFDQLPELDSVTNKFDGILCSAVLMHIPQIQLFDAIVSIKNRIKENGNILLSIPHHYPGIDKMTLRDNSGRLYNGITANQLILLFERLGFKLIEKWEDRHIVQENELTWISILLRFESGNIIKPLDSIEAILNKDLKVATYKLALFRALAELATTNGKAGQWNPDGFVLLPIDLIIEKWIEYYWPIFEFDGFIPQIQKESENYPRQISFRQSLMKLIQQYKFSGGFNGFHIDEMRLKLQKVSLNDYGDVKSKIKSTIINGPVRHAGGYSSKNKLFNYDHNGNIIIPDLIWKELILLGSWIIDSTILRWAELTSKFSNGQCKPSTMIDLLITEEKSRQIDDVRKIYKQQQDIHCVWTSQKIMDFDVDHIIPFSLWKNNDLWNLVPTKSSVNRDKSDKLVSANHLIKTKDNIVFYWEVLFKNEETRFINEAKILTGQNLSKNNWENSLFSGLKEAIECTAIQRRIERWEPR